MKENMLKKKIQDFYKEWFGDYSPYMLSLLVRMLAIITFLHGLILLFLVLR